ncbi:MAG TPA: MFS transporter [Gaiellaceae bacterium]|nr:MFS transporter [Gaiellaceae bacterium]
MTALASRLRSLDPRLPRTVYILQAGGLVNAFGNGVVLPFLVIYLHNVRGISLGLAGLAGATQSATALLAGFAAGSLSDRIGPRRVLLASLAVMAVAFGLMPGIREVWQAFALYALWGLGSGSFWPAQSALLAGLAPVRRRSTAYALQRLTMNVGVALGGAVAGLIASVAHPRSFTVLFLLDVCTFVGYGIVVALRVPSPALHPDRASGTWGAVLRDRTMVSFSLLNAVFMASAIALVVEMLPAFAKNVARVDERAIGVVFALDSIAIVALQLPVAKRQEGRRRMRGLALMGAVWAVALVGVWAGGAWTTADAAAAVFAAATVVFAFGETLHGAIHAPLSADLAPPQLVGRYLALASLSWQAGWIVGPAVGGVMLQHAPLALWPAAAAVNVVCAGWALALERRLPERLRRTPHGEEPAGAAAGRAGYHGEQ